MRLRNSVPGHIQLSRLANKLVEGDIWCAQTRKLGASIIRTTQLAFGPNCTNVRIHASAEVYCAVETWRFRAQNEEFSQ